MTHRAVKGRTPSGSLPSGTLPVCLACLGFLAAPQWVAAAQPDAPAPPRYRLEVGQKLVYSQQSRTEGDHEEASESRLTFWVVDGKDDGSWHLIGMRGEGDDATLGQFQLFPDGRIEGDPLLLMRLAPDRIFPRLPDTADEMQSGWTAPGRDEGSAQEGHGVAAAGGDGAAWHFEVRHRAVWDPIYLTSTVALYRFDRDRGLVTQAETRMRQQWGFDSRSVSRTELTSVEEVAEAQREPFAAAARVYFEATARYTDQLRAVRTMPEDKAQKVLDQAVAILGDAQDEVAVSPFQEQLAARIKQHESYEDYYLDSAREFAQRIGRPSPDWNVTDIDGKPRSLKDYRGKVVVLDFWYRGCGWCIKAMPQLKELADDFEGEPVAVLGMNTDRQEADARHVIEAMALNYETIKAGGLNRDYGVSGFPTLVLIDQEGVVRDYHVGYSPTLRDELSGQVRELLGETE